MNWPLIGLAVFLSACAIFAVCLVQGPRLRAGIAVGIVNLLVVGLHAVAPIRGLLDPGYVGYGMGLIRVPAGPGVTAVAGTVLLGALAAACIAVRSRGGPVMLVVVVVDGLLALNWGAAMLRALARGASFTIQFGEFLTIPGALAFLINLLLFVSAPAAAAVWAWRRRAAAG